VAIVLIDGDHGKRDVFCVVFGRNGHVSTLKVG